MIGQSALFSLWRDTYEEVVVHGEIVVCKKDRIDYHSSESVGAFAARGLLDPWLYLSADVVPEGAAVPRRHLSTSHRDFAIRKLCQRRGWDAEHYSEVDHPFFSAYLGMLQAELGTALSRRPTTSESGGLPTVVLLSTEVARLYQHLASAPRESALGRLRAGLLDYPDWVGDPHQLDAQLMHHNPGRVIAKTGEEGLLAMAVLPSPSAPEGLGVLLKLGSGHDHTSLAIALRPLLQRLELDLPSVFLPLGQAVRYHYEPFGRPSSLCIDISPRVSEQLAVWPGDVGYSRRVTFDTGCPPRLLVSHIQTTVHLGAHTDAVNHFGHTERGIDQAELHKYLGPCQVIDVKLPRAAAIVPADLTGVVIRANRVLFRTGSYPDPAHFNTDFNVLSPELVDYLASQGVILVGLDTPSVDAFSSKELPAHHATARAGMAILEGVILDSVSPGLYELIALPLKLADADASPVRAILRPL